MITLSKNKKRVWHKLVLENGRIILGNICWADRHKVKITFKELSPKSRLKQ